MADLDVIAAKLDSMHRCLRRLRDKTPADLQTLVGDPDTQDIIALNLTRRLRSAVGFRNIAVHSYQAIDWAIVDRILRSHLVDFEEFARAVVGAAGLR